MWVGGEDLKKNEKRGKLLSPTENRSLAAAGTELEAVGA